MGSERLRGQVVYHQLIPETAPVWADLKNPFSGEITDVMKAAGISRLYRHQAESIDLVRSGQHVVVATPTASGKTMTYNLPLLEKVLEDARSRGLYIFPLKALAQDQLRIFDEMGALLKTIKPTARIYDGDTSAWHRKRIREKPPNVILTNPEMLHLALLPYHQSWSTFFSNLKLVVIDEVHTYRGVMGSHMAQVFRRFIRVCNYYGAAPTFIFSSATIANPAQLATQLTGLQVKTIIKNGAPQGKRHVVFINPYEGSAQSAIMLLKAALHREMRTIVYTQSRKLTELIAIWAKNRSGAFADRISAYRAGFLPEERRSIEAKLSSGELLAVVSTSALELGIDIGDLDLCILVGYPGTVISTWQRGGRVGRSGQDSALVLIAGEDALDQYFMRNPQDFITREPEAAVVNPYNSIILSRHLTCAAVELPLRKGEAYISEPAIEQTVYDLEQKGELLRSADGDIFYSSRKAPHRHVDLRGTGDRFTIVSSDTEESRGEIDGFRAFKETHAGAVYLHKGSTYLVDHLDLETQTVKVSTAQVNYYTRVRGHKHTEILEIIDQKPAWGTTVCLGRLKVTDQVTGYEKWTLYSKKRLNIIPLDLPPLIFETEGLWFLIPPSVQYEIEAAQLHFMGGIHAMEHASIGVFPLLVMVDRNDLGGISTPFHPQTTQAAVFIYDGIPAGAGLSRQAFQRAEDLLSYTLKAIQSCSCESGCPSCVHSPKCGSGNRPIDKVAAIFLLERLKYGPKSFSRNKVQVTGEKPRSGKPLSPPPPSIHYAVLDIETQRSFQEVGGWHRADLMNVSCAVLYDSRNDRYYEFLEDQVQELIVRLAHVERVIGFNIKRFDYRVLSAYSNTDFRQFPTLDILDEIYKHLGYRLPLDHLARVTLGIQKSADGLQALKWWAEGKIREIIDYCRQDVEITKNLYLYGRKNHFLLFNNKAGNTVRIPVQW